MNFPLIYDYIQQNPDDIPHTVKKEVLEVPVKENVFLLLTPSGELTLVENGQPSVNPQSDKWPTCVTYALHAMDFKAKKLVLSF